MAVASKRFQQHVRHLGEAIFELAADARPRFWQQAWWAERMTRWIDLDPRLKAQAFQFVDCLPALGNHAAITRHLSEYLDPAYVELPAVVQAVLQSNKLAMWRDDLIGVAARFGATQMAGRFIAGFDVPSTVKTIENLRAQGMGCTIDVLGESTTSDAQARRYAGVYHTLIDRLSPISRQWPALRTADGVSIEPTARLNLSIKLTGLDPHFDAIDPDRAMRQASVLLRPLLIHARQAGAFVNIDMESTKHRAITFELFKRILMEPELRDWSDVGIVVQAYLKDAEDDLHDLLAWGRQRGCRFAIRLVKGAYWDAETAAAVRQHKPPPVWTRKWESDACYERMTRTMLEHADLIRPAFASHNVRSLAVVLATAAELGRRPGDYEVQMLFGMGDPLKTAMVSMGSCVRVYCPYGDLMPGMGYLIRRLLENTSNDSFLKQGFEDRSLHDERLADPTVARPPSSPLPQRHYQDSHVEDAMSGFINASHTNFSDPSAREKMKGAIDYVHREAGRSYSLVLKHEPVTTDEWFESHNPSRRDQVIGRIASATTSDADRAVAAAYKAFHDWSMSPAVERAALLRRAADRMEMRRFELAATMVLEVGKPWREADADVTEAVDHARYYANQIERIEARPRIRDIPGEDNRLIYTPKGVCAVISPWTFPLAILTGMTTAALAAGNTIVVKPARQASVTAAKLIEILIDAGFPPGVIGFLPGPGDTVGRHLVEHEDVNIVAFTGSPTVGADVIRAGATVRPGQAFIRKMIVEMGGKNAILVDDDADLDAVTSAVIESAFAYAGQKCSSCSRLIVLEGVYDALAARLTEAVKSITIGPAEAPATMTGPVIDETAQTLALASIETGKREGRFLVQSELPPDTASGWFVPPTVITDVSPDSILAQNEILGPVLVMLAAADFDDALRIANGTRFALTGGLFSRSPSRIERARREFAVGNLYINRKITGSQVDAQPFGGFRLSGTGVKAGSPDYLLHFMDARCITENTTRSGFVPTEEQSEVT